MKTLGEVCTIVKKLIPFDGEVPYYSTGSVNYDGSIVKVDRMVTMLNKPSRAGRTPNCGDVGFAKMKRTIKIIMVTEELSNCIFSTGFTFLRVGPELIPKYLYYFLISNDFHKQKNYLTGDGIMGSIKERDTLNIYIPVPTLEEQQRIVSVLDETFGDLNKSSDQIYKKILNTSELYQTNLNSIFAENTNWETGLLGNVTGGVQTGPFGSLLHKSDYITNGIPIINPAHITKNGIVPDENKTITVETANRLSNYLLKSGDVVLGRRGEMGRCAVVKEKEEGWLCGTGSFFIKSSEKIDANFLVNLIWSDKYRIRLNKIATGTTMKNLSNKSLSNLVIQFPSRNEQNKIVEKLDNLFMKIEKLQESYSRQYESVEKLKQSILKEAFIGNL